MMSSDGFCNSCHGVAREGVEDADGKLGRFLQILDAQRLGALCITMPATRQSKFSNP